MMEWREIRGCVVRYESGEKLGVLKELLLSEKGGRISHLKAAPPLIWGILKGRFGSKAVVPTDFAHYRHPDIFIADESWTDGLEGSGELARLSRLNNAEVFAGRGWRIGRLVGIHFDPSSWSLEKLEIDTYPEYLISPGTHSQKLPRVFPPIARVTVRGDGVEFKPADGLQKSFSVVISAGGEKIEENLVELLAKVEEEHLEDRTDIIQRAFDRAYDSIIT